MTNAEVKLREQLQDFPVAQWYRIVSRCGKIPQALEQLCPLTTTIKPVLESHGV